VILEGDARVPKSQWPICFSGILRGSPARTYERGNIEVTQATAYDRSVYYRHRRITSARAWQPTDTDANLGDICVQIATNVDWGMALTRQEVLFGRFYDDSGAPVRINKKLQVVDIPPMEALTNIMQVVRREPAFNGEGKLVARPVDLTRPAIRQYVDEALIHKLDVQAADAKLPTSVTVTGLDYRLTKVEWNTQKVLTVGPVMVGFFNPRISKVQPYSEDNEHRVEPEDRARNWEVQGQLTAQLFGLDSDFRVEIDPVDDFRCRITIVFEAVEIAILIVTVELAAYLALKAAAGSVGQTGQSIAAWALDAAATAILFHVMHMMTALGTVNFEVWGKPFEYVYQELEAKAMLADAYEEEDSGEEVENHILGTLEECELLARDLLIRKVAETAGRNVSMSYDFLIEPNDVIQVLEDGNIARYYVLEVSKQYDRGGDSSSLEVTGFRIA
jgi:hypothetical protein